MSYMPTNGYKTTQFKLHGFHATALKLEVNAAKTFSPQDSPVKTKECTLKLIMRKGLNNRPLADV